MNRDLARRVARIETQQHATDLLRLFDAELDAQVAATVSALQRTHSEAEFRAMSVDTPAALPVFGLTNQEMPHALH